MDDLDEISDVETSQGKRRLLDYAQQAPSVKQRSKVSVKPKLRLSLKPKAEKDSPPRDTVSLKGIKDLQAWNEDPIEDIEPESELSGDNVASDSTFSDAKDCAGPASPGQADKPTNSRYLGQLKQVLHESLQYDSCQYTDLKILDRSFGFQLTTCRCELLETKCPVVAIFDTRVCSNLDLQPGRLVRIYAPWHELPDINGLGRIILCTYNSEMLPESDAD